MRARFLVFYPWEFMDENGTLEMCGEIAAMNSESLKVDLDRNYVADGAPFRHFEARPRHVGGSFSELSESHSLPVNISIDDRRFLIGSVSLIESEL